MSRSTGRTTLTLTGDGEPERIRVARGTTTLASVLRVSPALGRWFTEAEGVPGASQVAVLSHGLWMRRYGGDAGILGRPVVLGGVPTEVIGVMPASFAFPDPRVDVWIADPITRTTGFGIFTHTGVARLRDGATVEDARAELNGLIADLPQAYPGDPLALGNGPDIGLFSTARTLKEATIGGVARALWILLASVGLVLLVACANVANLFLVRSEARQREVAVRRALGAGSSGIARYFLTESVLLSIAGGVVGLALAWGAVRLLVAFGPTNLPRLHEIRLDGVALAFTFALSLLAGLAFGAIPLLRGAPLAASLHESGRGSTASRGRHRARHLLMGGQVALALVLLVSSGLMVRSFQKLRTMDPGFDATSALTFSIGLPERGYPRSARGRRGASRHSRPAVVAAGRDGRVRLHVPAARGRLFGQYAAGRGPNVSTGHGAADRVVPRRRRRLLRGDGHAAGSRPRHRSGRRRAERARRRHQRGARETVLSESGSDRPARRLEPPAGTTGEPPNLTWLTIVGVVANTPRTTLAEAPSRSPGLHADVHRRRTGHARGTPWLDRTSP